MPLVWMLPSVQLFVKQFQKEWKFSVSMMDMREWLLVKFSPWRLICWRYYFPWWYLPSFSSLPWIRTTRRSIKRDRAIEETRDRRCCRYWWRWFLPWCDALDWAWIPSCGSSWYDRQRYRRNWLYNWFWYGSPQLQWTRSIRSVILHLVTTVLS